MTSEVFWRIEGGKKIVSGTPSQDQRAEQNTVVTYDDSAPFSSDKIRAKILDLGYGGARRALHNLCPKSARILSAAITIDGWTGACSDDLAPRRG